MARGQTERGRVAHASLPIAVGAGDTDGFARSNEWRSPAAAVTWARSRHPDVAKGIASLSGVVRRKHSSRGPNGAASWDHRVHANAITRDWAGELAGAYA
jgi:hypothetical protein